MAKEVKGSEEPDLLEHIPKILPERFRPVGLVQALLAEKAEAQADGR